MKPATICLSPGHTPTAPGAKRGNVTEYGLSSAIIGDLVFRLDKAGHIAHLIGSDSNINQVARINKIAPDFGLELHFNASTSAKMHGTEVLHSGSDKGRDLAESIHDSLYSNLDTYPRGCPVGHYQLDPKNKVIPIIRLTSCPFIVVEPLFLSNDKDFEKIDIPLISIALFDGIISYWEATT